MKELAKRLGLNEKDIDIIYKKLDREPTETEIFIFSAQWSEHCGYRHSKEILKKEFGEIDAENAGYITVDNKAVIFKVESHNHPSAIEPFQGAATGIGGIVRDILAMGAEPIALLDLIKFGDINDNHSRNLFEGVVSGISSYGNSIGIPTVGGQTSFDDAYKTNPIVNVMCIGIVDKDNIKSSSSNKKDGLLAYFGSKTGRDGIHGASFASKTLKGKEDRVSVQIGDPFAEKNLIDATLEIAKLDGIYAVQDMGAAGLLSSSSEIAYKSDCGCRIDIEKVPLREENMEAWEVLLSESQERMLLVIDERAIEPLKKIAYKYYLDFEVIGNLIPEKKYKIYYNGDIKADLDINFLVNTPSKYYEVKFDEIKNADFIKAKEKRINKINKSNAKILEALLLHPDFSSQHWVYEQYDYMIKNSTVVEPGSTSSILWIKDTNKGIATAILDNHLQTYLDPYKGSFNLVFNAARKIIVSGANPKGVTDNLNFGNPENKDVMYQFKQSVKAIADACRFLKIPVVSGNVSFYNEIVENKVKKSIYPTPVIGIVGEVEDIKNIMTDEFKNLNDKVYLIGKVDINKNKTGGSYFLKVVDDFIGGEIDTIDVNFELKLYALLKELISKKIINSAANVSKGGLLYSIFKSTVKSNFGFEGYFENDDPFSLFGENQSRVLVSVSSDFETILKDTCKKYGIDFKYIGDVVIDGFILNYNNNYSNNYSNNYGNNYDDDNNYGYKNNCDDGNNYGSADKKIKREIFDYKRLKEIYFNNIKNHME